MATAEAPAENKETFSKETIEKITSQPMGAKGVLEIKLPDELTIDLDFESVVEDGRHTLTAIGQVEEGGKPFSVSVGQLFKLLDSSVSLPDVLSTVKLELEYILFSYDSGGAGEGRKWLWAVDLSFLAPDLSKMPLLGTLIKDIDLKIVDDLLLLYSSNPLDKEAVDALNEKLPEDKPKISIPKEAKDDTQVIHKGINVSGHLSYSANPALLLPGAKPDEGGEQSGEQSGDQSGDQSGEQDREGSENDGGSAGLDVEQWFKVQKKLGPISIDKIGVSFDLEKLELGLMLDAGFAAGGFSLDIDDFRISNPLTRFDPTFDINGLAVAYNNSEIDLAGALVKLKGKDDTGAEYTEFVGEIKVAIGDEITVVAIGAYATYKHEPSFFAYGFVGYPIPLAPTDIEIDGFALGLGFNQTVHAPNANDVAKFPFVAQVMPGAPEQDENPGDQDKASQAKALLTQFDNLQDYISPHIDTFFGAAGVKIKGYDMLDFFALGIVEVGTRFEIDLMGLGSITVPTPKSGEGEESTPTMAYIGLSFVASIAISDGYFGACASITPDSYMFMPGLSPSGGFAAYAWWEGEHAGDFVVSIGGYNPNFEVPDHYPSVSRLSIPFGEIFPGLPHPVASGYAALCPHAIMAGFGFEIVWSIWIATASLSFNLDLLLAWKPFHLEADITITLCLSAHIWFIHISIEIGATLSIWGPIPNIPAFATQLKIHAGPFQLTITNPPGASRAAKPEPIDWSEFKASFLPKDDHAICPLRVNQGVVTQRKQSDGTTLFVVNPKDLHFTADSLIPIQKSAIGDAEPAAVAGANTQFGIAPMGIALGDVETVQTIKISRDGESYHEHFAFTPVFRRYPSGMWGDALTPELNGARFVEGLHTGFQIAPAQPPKPGKTRDLERTKLQFDPTTVDFRYASLLPFERLYPSSDEETLLRAMGFEP